MIEIIKKDIEQLRLIKRVWSKPKLISGKEIGFLGLGHVQTTPSTDFS